MADATPTRRVCLCTLAQRGVIFVTWRYSVERGASVDPSKRSRPGDITERLGSADDSRRVLALAAAAL
jgi:hypothetical protein